MADDPTDDTISRAAWAWLARRDRGLTDAEMLELAQWKAADSRHAVEFEQISETWRDYDLAKADLELVAMARELEVETRAPRRNPRRVWFWTAGCAAAAAVLLVTFVRLADRPEPRVITAGSSAMTSPLALTYEIVPSTARQMTLTDGSVIDLRGDGEAEMSYSANARHVRIVRGEAFFSVVSDPARPFIVSANAVAVRAVGTAFNVKVSSATIEVLVTEGKVRIDDAARGASLLPMIQLQQDSSESDVPVLAAGHRAVIAVQAGASAPTMAETAALGPGEIEQELGWRNTLVVFQRTPLSDAVDAFNRYGAGRLTLGDPALASRLLGGTFRVDNVDAFVRLLEKSADVRAERRDGNELVLWPE